MVKKGKILFSALLLIIILPMFISADNNESDKVAQGYNCLETKVKDNCDELSTEEKIFSLLAIRGCKNELLDDLSDQGCLPSSGCKIKTTAQALLALDKVNQDTSDIEDWLLTQNKTPTNLVWYLQIDSDESIICEISYSGNEYSIAVNENKKVSSGAGCLSPAQNNYWLEISQSCYDEEFTISCDKPFITNLLFKKRDSQQIYVSADTHYGSAEGRTKEKVNSFCFSKGGECDYEGSLWSTLVLDYLGYDVDSFVPYLVTMSETNTQYIPESFLYSLTDETDYRLELLEKQKFGYWDESGDKYYDTALAMQAFMYEDFLEKDNAKEWLLDAQDNQGCWKGNILNTAFILYSLWPKDFGSSGGGTIDIDDCEIDADGFCITSSSCEEAGGTELYAYSSSCTGLNVCCDKDKKLETCEELNGDKCNSNEECSGSTLIASDTDECCLGYCRVPTVEEDDCELYGGTCRTSCFDDEEETIDKCSFGDVCCIQSSEPEKKSYWWIWILLILIILVLLAIFFRDKLRPYWFKLKSKFSKKPKGPPSRPMYPFGQRPSDRRLVPRRPINQIRPMQQRQPVLGKGIPLKKQPPQPKKQKPDDFDDVLKKLKEMGQ